MTSKTVLCPPQIRWKSFYILPLNKELREYPEPCFGNEGVVLILGKLCSPAEQMLDAAVSLTDHEIPAVQQTTTKNLNNYYWKQMTELEEHGIQLTSNRLSTPCDLFNVIILVIIQDAFHCTAGFLKLR